MKNVTGLDLVKISCGALGTLGLVTEATFKLQPEPRATATIVIRRLDDARAVEAMARALGSPHGVSGAATIHAGMGREFPRTLLRVEGFEESVAYRTERLIALLQDFGAKHALTGEDSAKMWRAIRDVALSRGATRPRRLAREPEAVGRAGGARGARRRRARVLAGPRRRVYLVLDRPDAASRRRRSRRALALPRPCRVDPRRRWAAGESRRVHAALAGAGAAHARRETRARPEEPHQPRPHVRRHLMQTHFAPEKLADPEIAGLEKIIRSCVHCGFCTATCPTYVVGRDERDSPRGRIYLIKDLLETGRAPDAHDVEPLDHCLSCLSCMTTCPSGVDYRRLIDHAREEVETRYTRDSWDRALRATLVRLLPSRRLFRLAMSLARLGRPLGPILARLPRVGPRLDAMLKLAPARLTPRGAEAGVFEPTSARRGRVALLTGCAQAVLAPEINAATIRVLNRAGVEVVLPKGEGCCGSLAHHMGYEDRALAAARADIDAWTREIDGEGLDAIVVTASGCGATIKDYPAMFSGDAAYAEKARKVAALAKDVSEYLFGLDLEFPAAPGGTVAYHPACSLQHGQKILDAPKRLLAQAGFTVRVPAEAHLCCGSAGVYNILQPEIAAELRDRKVRNLSRLKADVIATGNIGCITQIGAGTATPVVHVAQLLDWAQGGPSPLSG